MDRDGFERSVVTIVRTPVATLRPVSSPLADQKRTKTSARSCMSVGGLRWPGRTQIGSPPQAYTTHCRRYETPPFLQSTSPLAWL